MKNKILLSILLTILTSFCTSVFAQDGEYYRPDSLRNEKQPKNEQVKDDNQAQKDADVKTKKLEDFKDRSFQERLRIGGGFGLSFGSVANVNVSPMVGYELTEKFVAGVGVTIMYFKSDYYDINTMYYGAKTLMMYKILPIINLMGELEFMNVEGSYQQRQWITSPMLGAAYSQPLGSKFIKAAHISLLYNLNYNNQIDHYSGQNLSPYGSAFVFRVTFL